MLSNNVSHKQKVKQKKMSKLIRKAEEWEEWHGTWLEATLNQFFDKYSVKAIKSEILRYILEDDADKEDVVHLMFYETVKDFFGKEPNKGVNPDEVVGIGAAIQARSTTDVCQAFKGSRRGPKD